MLRSPELSVSESIRSTAALTGAGDVTLPARVLNFSERLATSPSAYDTRDPIVERWMRTLGVSDPDALRSRCVAEGLDPDAAPARLLVDGDREVFGEWSAVLDRLPSRVSAIDRVRHDEVAYCAIWAPFLYAGRQLLASRSRRWSSDSISPQARFQCERQLMLDLAVEGIASAAVDHGDEPLDDFVRRVTARRYRSWREERPLLVRRLARVVTAWVDSLHEMLEAWACDREEIHATFGSAADRIESIRPGLSDPHRGGRRVARVRFGSGLALAWQPRNVGMLDAWNQWLRRLQRIGIDTPPVLRVVDRDTHGWAEWCQVGRLRSPAAAEEWFTRAGALLALAQIAGARDLHMENIVATAEGPVIVDAEALLQPRRSAGSSAAQRAQDWVGESPAANGFLSFQVSGQDGTVREIGGLAGRGGYPIDGGVLSWEPRGEGWSSVVVDAVAGPAANLPIIGNEPAMADEHADAICRGYRRAMEQLAAHAGDVYEAAEICFAGCVARVVLRPTETYANVLATLREPRFQNDGLAAGWVVETLVRPLLDAPTHPWWSLVAGERRALESGDIPVFEVPVGGTAISVHGGGTAAGTFAQPGLAAMLDRVTSLGPAIVEEWTAIVRTTLGAGVEAPPGDDAPLTRHASRRRGGYMDVAVVIADSILERAIGSGESIAFVAPEYLRRAAKGRRGIELTLDHGAAGIALALSNVGRASGERRFIEAAAASLGAIHSLAESEALDSMAAHENLGVLSGIGSIVYALSNLAAQLDSDRCLRTARRFSRLLTQSRIESDAILDLEGGLAGALLGLGALASLDSSDDTLSTGQACASRLAATSIATTHGASWPLRDGEGETGAAHGNAGVVLALARWREVTGDGSHDSLIDAAIRDESSRWNEEMSNWPTATGSGALIDMRAWCHGSPGILSSRIGTGPVSAADVLRAAESTIATGLAQVDHLCCGNAGRIDALIDCARETGHAAWMDEARLRADAMLERRDTRRIFRLRADPADDATFHPGLLKGLAGIAWTLARIDRPNDVPSILTFPLPGRRS